MSNYGRNFEFRQSPDPMHRLGRYINGALKIPNGVPVKVPDGSVNDAQKRLPLALATGAQAPKKGACGIIIHEWAFNWQRGVDPVMTSPSDMDYVPANTPAQLIFGDEVKVALKNTVDRKFPTNAVGGGTNYTGRIMVPGVTAVTPAVDVDDLLTPGVGNDDDGYWAVTTVEANAWLRVTLVNGPAGIVEAQMLF